MNKEKKIISQEEIERRREDYKRYKESQPDNEQKLFVGEMCKIRLNPPAEPFDEEYTGKVMHISNNGIILNDKDNPLFTSWNSIRTIELDTLNVKPRP